MSRIVNLKTEFEKKPLQLDNPKPRISWVIESDDNNSYQVAYRIRVWDYMQRMVWDTGIIESSDTFGITYNGASLHIDTRYYWCVTVWDNSGNMTESETAEFHTGLFGIKPSDAIWITHTSDDPVNTAPMFRKKFNSENVAFATLIVASRGWYEAYINGKKVDTRVLAPAHSNNDKPAYCDSYDVTDFIINGENALGIWLSEGYGRFVNMYGWKYHGEKRIWACLNITYQNGECDRIVTDKSWKWMESPILRNHIYDGEVYDARLYNPAWAMPEFDEINMNAVQISEYQDNIVAHNVEPMRVCEVRQPKEIIKTAENVTFVDFGQNCAGWCHIKVKGEKGAKVIIRHSERGKNGKLLTWTNRNAEATDTYILSGDGIEEYSPRFTYHGFRVAEVTIEGNAELVEITAPAIYTDIKNNTHFECSDKLINQIYSNMIWSAKSNLMTFITDCPSRDERTNCTMDTQVYEETMMHEFDSYSYLKEWFLNHLDQISYPDWTGNIVTLAYLFYKYYGVIDFVKENYGYIKRFIMRMEEQFPDFYIDKFFGDWTSPNPTEDYNDSFSCVEETNTILFCWQLEMAAELARKFGYLDDEKYYLELRERSQKTCYERFFDEKTYTFGRKQTPTILAISLGVVKPEDKEKTVKGLINRIKNDYGVKMDTGIFGTRFLLDALCESKEGIDLARELLLGTEYPSFGNQIVEFDATTTFEQWYGICNADENPMLSLNHGMYAGMAVDFHKKFAGILNAENCYEVIRIEPKVPSGMEFVNCNVDTVRGNIVSNWKKKDGNFIISVNIPANCSAEIIMPFSNERHTVTNGRFTFSEKIQ